MGADILETIRQKKDQILSMVMNEILASNYLGVAVEKLIATSGYFDEKIQKTLNTFRIASEREIEDIQERIIRIERKVNRIAASIEEVKENQNTRSKRTAQAQPREAVCEACGKKFEKKSMNQRFCSASCRSKFSTRTDKK